MPIGMFSERSMLLLWTLVIVGGIALFTVVGLSHS